jgi:hypothetical protein
MKYYCKDCNKEVSSKPTIRCRTCYVKFIRLHPNNLKDGRTLKILYCVDCNKQLNKLAYCQNSTQCKSCNAKQRFKNPKNHPRWCKGLSFEPYTIKFNEQLKESIRERDGHKCQLCQSLEKELKGFHRKLAVHHIDYNKQNCKEENLISLCVSCNIKVNTNRDYYYALFMYIMESYICI